MKSKAIYSVFIVLLSVACKHEHPAPSQKLKAAFNIQKQALVEIENIEKALKDLPSAQQQKLIEKKKLWESNMIEIEGMQHDHSQCDGDHSKQRFSISDDEMLSAQTEWRDSILALKKEVFEALE